MKLNGELKIILGASLFSFIPVGVKLDPASGIVALIFGRLLISCIVLSILNRQNREFFLIDKKQFIHLAIWASLMLSAMLFYYYSINTAGVAVSSALLGTQPLILVLLAATFLKERITLKIGAATLMTIIGIACLLNLSSLDSGASFLGQLSAIFSAIFLGFVFVYQKKFLMNLNVLQSVFYQSLFQFIMLIPLLLFFPPVMSLNYLGSSLLLGIVCTVLAYGLLYSGVKMVAVQKIGILQSVEYVIPVVIGVLFYGERLTLLGITGIGIILISCIMIQLNINSNRRIAQD